MHPLLWLGLLSFGAAFLLTPIFRDLSQSFGFVDHPDDIRKMHKHPTPRVGGIAIALAYVSSIMFMQWRMHMISDTDLALVWKILPGAAVIFVLGVFDDLLTLTSRQKLAGQFVGACVAYSAGVRLVYLGGNHYDAWWTMPATILWLLACTNAFNLVDGMDGLAGGVGFFSTMTILIAALISHNTALAIATVPLAGCLLGFLCFNFNPATIFLGDSGSLVIGFLLGCYGVIWSTKSATILGMTAPLIAVSLPLVDVALAIARRFISRKPIFSADRGHIHHRLLDRGLSPRQAVLLLYGICCIVAVISIVQMMFQSSLVSGVVILVFLAITWVGVQFLGYTEFSLAGKMLLRGGMQQILKAQLDLNAFEKVMEACNSPEECRKHIAAAAERFGLTLTEMQLPDDYWFLHGSSEKKPWTLQVPFGSACYANFSRNSLSDHRQIHSSATIGPFADSIREALTARLAIEGALSKSFRHETERI